MQFILLRHAEKTTDYEKEPSLSPYGQSQAQNLLKLVNQKQLPVPTHLFCSPRSRTAATLSFLATHFKLKTQSSDLLDLKLPSESGKDFRLRIQEFLVAFQLDIADTPKEKKVVYVCTHQDWAEEFLSIVECSSDLMQPKYQHWASGQYMLLEKSDLWHVLDYKTL